jgi:hypothetical protein
LLGRWIHVQHQIGSFETFIPQITDGKKETVSVPERRHGLIVIKIGENFLIQLGRLSAEVGSKPRDSVPQSTLLTLESLASIFRNDGDTMVILVFIESRLVDFHMLLDRGEADGVKPSHATGDGEAGESFARRVPNRRGARDAGVKCTRASVVTSEYIRPSFAVVSFPSKSNFGVLLIPPLRLTISPSGIGLG